MSRRINRYEFIGSKFVTPKGGVLTVKYLISEKIKVAKYILECSICSVDGGLWPCGSIQSNKYNLENGARPCGCSLKTKWKEFQANILVKRMCDQKGYQFLGWSGKYTNFDCTKVKLHNPVTGNTWQTTSISHLLQGASDPQVSINSFVEFSKKDDNVYIEEFLSSGKYHNGTKFVRNKDRFTYWDVTCGNCKLEYTSRSESVKLGHKGCDCSRGFGYKMDVQSEFYVVYWFGCGGTFLKFGKTNKTCHERVGRQHRDSKLDYRILHRLKVTGQEVHNAELGCIRHFKDISSACPREWLPDGFTETIPYSEENLNKIMEIVSNYNLTPVDIEGC